MGEWSWSDRAILIVDGDRESRHATAGALYRAGFEIREAASGHEALEVAEREELALVIIEVRLPDISGYEVCRRLREEDGGALPILFVSGDRVESFDRVAGFIAGADDYLVKPVAQDELIARVRRQLERAQATADAHAGLTPREQEVLELLADGLGPLEIGSRLSISPKTVATHVEHIYAKLGVHTRAQAVASAFRLALVD